jgi:hypothetical protein
MDTGSRFDFFPAVPDCFPMFPVDGIKDEMGIMVFRDILQDTWTAFPDKGNI